jgi:Amt family ammonium transporter
MDNLKTGTDAMFILLGAIMVLAMHAGFAFLELGTVRKKNQVNALVKILVDFAVSTISYFFIGYTVAYGVQFMSGADVLAQKSGYELVKFFFLATFAAIPAIISGGIAERSRSTRNWQPRSCWSVSSTPSSKASRGTTDSASRTGSPP